MKKSFALILVAIIAFSCVLTSCESNSVQKEVADVTSGVSEEGGTAAEETYVTSPYVNVTDVDGNAVTVIGEDGNVYYQQMLRTDAEKVAVTDANGQTETQVTNTAEEPATQLVKIENNASVGNAQATEIVKGFLETLTSGAFYLKGSMQSEGELLPVEFSICGQDASMMTSMDGITVKLSVIDGETYLVSDERQNYMVLGTAVKKMLDIDDMDLAGMMADFGQTEIDYDKVVVKTEAVDGVMYDTLTYEDPDSTGSSSKFYMANGELVKMQMYSEGVLTGELNIEDIKGNLTSNDLAIPANYEKIGYIEFISQMMEDSVVE